MNARLAAIDCIAACLQVLPSAEATRALLRRIRAGQVPWETVLCLANRHLLAPALAAAFEARGLGEALPGDVDCYLRALYGLNLRRNGRLRDELGEVTRALNDIGVRPVLLKGAISLVTPVYAHPGARIMTDLDILVPRDRIDACRVRIEALGYRTGAEYANFPADHHHIAPLSREGAYAAVELHHLLVPRLTTGVLFGARLSAGEAEGLTTRLLENAECVDIDGLALGLPPPAFQVLHLVLHSALLDREHRDGAMPLRALHELALVLAVHRDALDPGLIRAALADKHKGAILDDWLYLAHRLFGGPLPEGIRQPRHAQAHYHRCRLQARLGMATSYRGLLGLAAGGPRDPRMQCA
jgi:hypothetical protein